MTYADLAVLVLSSAAVWVIMAVAITAMVEGIAWGIGAAGERLARWMESHSH